MKRLSKTGALVAGGIAAGAAALATGALLWNRATTRAVRRLRAGARPRRAIAAGAGAGDVIPRLPPPVRRFFEFALTPGQPFVERARLEQAGEFLLRPGSWKPFTAVEHFSVHPPGFVWDATIRMAPLISVRVRDSYLGGEGIMHGRVAALLPVVDQRGTPEMASASLVRYLAECAWIPTALLPGDGVAWEAIDDSSARVTLDDGDATVSLDVHFGPTGEIVQATADRYRDVDGAPVLTPWAAHYTDYARVEGMMVPMSGEVEWVLPEGPQPYWRGRIVDVDFELAP